MAKIVYNKENRFVSVVRDDIPVAEGYSFIITEDPPEDLSTEYVLENETWVRKPELSDTSLIIESMWKWVRSERNRLLQSTDWTQLPDVPTATKEAWATYRQQLRDITNQSDPFNIVWPTPPG